MWVSVVSVLIKPLIVLINSTPKQKSDCKKIC